MYRRHFTTRFCKNVVMSKQLKNKVAVLAFFDLQKGSVSSTRISEQPTLLTKSTINCPCCARMSKISCRSRRLRQIIDLHFHLLFNFRLNQFFISIFRRYFHDSSGSTRPWRNSFSLHFQFAFKILLRVFGLLIETKFV